MPYKASGRVVLVKRGGRWVRFKVHDTEAAAERHARALNANMDEEQRRRRRRRRRQRS